MIVLDPTVYRLLQTIPRIKLGVEKHTVHGLGVGSNSIHTHDA